MTYFKICMIDSLTENTMKQEFAWLICYIKHAISDSHRKNKIESLREEYYKLKLVVIME